MGEDWVGAPPHARDGDFTGHAWDDRLGGMGVLIVNRQATCHTGVPPPPQPDESVPHRLLVKARHRETLLGETSYHEHLQPTPEDFFTSGESLGPFPSADQRRLVRRLRGVDCPIMTLLG